MSELANQFPIDLVKDITEKYLCPGCSCGSDPNTCDQFKPNDKNNFLTTKFGPVCLNHCAGTSIGTARGIIKIMLGFPKGFCRVPSGYSTFELSSKNPNFIEYIFETEYDNTINEKFTIPFWKHLDEHGNTIAKYFCPRINKVIVFVFVGNHLDKINCKELTKEDIEAMD